MFKQLQTVSGYPMTPLSEENLRTLGLLSLAEEVAVWRARPALPWVVRDRYIRGAISLGYGRGADYDRRRQLSGLPYFGPQYPTSLFFAARRWARERRASCGRAHSITRGEHHE